MVSSEAQPPETVSDPDSGNEPQVELDSPNNRKTPEQSEEAQALAEHPTQEADPVAAQAVAEQTNQEADPVGAVSGPIAQEPMRDLTSIIQALGMLSEAIIVKLRQPPALATPWERMRNGFVQFAKDVGPFVTGLGSITVSIVVGLLTVTVTASVAFFNYQVNYKQAQTTQMNLKTAALTDFVEVDDGKRTLAAIKLAAYGEDALPAIKLALGVTHEGIRTGGVQAAEIMYQSRPDLRRELLADMSLSFKESNATLRLGVLEFYGKAASQMEEPEQQSFLNELKEKLGANAKSCSDHDQNFVKEAAIFLSRVPFPEVTDLLLDIARNCPYDTHESARIQAINMLPIVVEDQKTPQSTRETIIRSLRALEVEGQDELNANIRTAIEGIQSVPNQ
jgi:hypothetical protein